MKYLSKSDDLFTSSLQYCLRRVEISLEAELTSPTKEANLTMSLLTRPIR